MKTIVISVDEFKELTASIIQEALKKAPSISEISKDEVEEGFITRKEAADYLRISLVTLDQLTRTDKIRGYRIGNRVLYDKAEVRKSLTSIRSNKYKRAA